MKVYGNAKSKSFGGSVYYNSNRNLNEYLRKRKSKKQLSDNGFKVVNVPIKKAYEIIRDKNEVWIFPPEMFKGKITQSGFVDKGKVFSHYGKILKKWKCQDGNIYLYSTKIQNVDEYRKVYVFTDKDRKVIGELWCC